MGKGKVEKKKKKGRPSLLDLQKRTLKERQQHQQQHKRQLKQNNFSHNYRNTRTPVRRSARRNPNPDGVLPEKLDQHNHDYDDDQLSTGKRRQKKLKLVLKLPSRRSSFNSASSNSCGSDSNVEDDNVASNHKKRKINAIGDGSGLAHSDKGLKSISDINPAKTPQGTHLDSGPSASLPDKKLLLFILDRLQKKDTYGVFSEPVDPNELPDYHEVIEHPMDFGTIRKKLDDGAYANLEQFEKDVFLICTNAMQYNAPDTIYFRQGRSIQELAKKNFENLRQDSDDNEPEPRVVRRGRPPIKNLKKPPVRTSLDHAGLESSSDATLVTGGENAMWTNYDMKKGPQVLQKSASADLSGRSHVTCSDDFYSNWLSENKPAKMDNFAGATSRGNTMKYMKKQFVLDENRRNTYKHSYPSAGGREPSVLTTFDGERKLLLPVGDHSEYGYARSLAQFAANLGPVAWKITSKTIEKCLSPGIKFGPGWVGENDLTQSMPVPRPSRAPTRPSPLHHLSGQGSLSASVLGTVESKNEKSSEKPEGNILSEMHAPSIHLPTNGHPTKPISPSFISSSSSIVANRSSDRITGKAEANGELNSPMECNLQSSSITVTRPWTSFQVHPSPELQPGVNGFNFAAHLGKQIEVPQPAGLNLHSSSVINTVPRSNGNFAHSAPANSSKSDDAKLPEISSVSSSSILANSRSESLVIPMPGLHPPPSRQQYQRSISGLPPQQKPESVPPDLNVRFQAPGSPNSGRVDSTPDLALQL